MKSRHTMDLTNGSLVKKLLIFVFPILVSNLLQHLYNAADNIVVGQYAGKVALAAVGSTSSATVLILNLLNGLAVGANVVCANYRGAQKQAELARCMHTAVLLSAVGGVLFGVFGFAVSRPLLQIMSCPENVIDQATLYMRIYCLGVPASMVYNFGAALLRAHGDTKRPMIILSLTGVVNVCLNLFFVLVFHMGVAGVAVATIVAQVISAILVLRILFSPDDVFQMRFRELRFHKEELWRLIKVGIPCGMNGLVFSISNVILQSSVNVLGDTVMAANAASNSLTNFIYLVLNSFYSACVSFTGQCFGAKEYRRIDQLLVRSIAICVLAVSLMAAVMTLFPRQLIGLYNTEPDVIDASIAKLMIVSWAYVLYVFSELTLGCLRGMGKSLVPMILNAFGICMPRLLWVWFFASPNSSLGELYLCYPISYVFSAAFLVSYFFLCRRKLWKPESESAM